MTDYFPRVGDKVRVVHEGVVTEADDFEGTFSLERDGDFEYHEAPGTSMVIELIEKAPRAFEVGTLVKSGSGTIFRTPHGWVWEDGLESTVDDGSVATWLSGANPAKVLYEPPTS